MSWARFLLVFFTGAAVYVGLVPVVLGHVLVAGCAYGIVYAGRRIDVLAPIAEPIAGVARACSRAGA